ncbi:hypothetical protein [Roseovarius sp. MMSF_3281]|uniref:hypothetical protein n=1 Tax=Roseovarius sp. MMSF_3281 TaxID=3046694 RepID=UPI00273F7C33|nr:hypothetical protein [Roseovarius sp. MMSF_3281]
MTKRLIKRVNPDVVVIEEAIASGGGGAQSRIQLAMGDRAAVMIICDQMGFKVREYAVPSIRKHFIGHGRLRRDVAKARTIARCRSLGWNVKNDNEADACAVWEFARAKLTGMASMPKGLFDARSEELQSKRG